ncbi:MAG: glycosyltransferase [Patescibacteria group bacterium]
MRMLSIVIPAYNEAERIGQTLDAYLRSFPLRTEFIIVPNGCTDGTVALVMQYQQQHSNIRVHVISEPVGKAVAVRTGLALATGDYVGYLDADGSTSPEEFQKLEQALGASDGVIASRWAPGAVVQNRAFSRTLASLTFAALVKTLFWFPYRDTQCGAKIFSKTLLQRILPHARVRNMAFDVELLLLARRADAAIVEMPTHWVDRSRSAILGTPVQLFRTSLQMFATLFLLRLRFLPLIAPRL